MKKEEAIILAKKVIEIEMTELQRLIDGLDENFSHSIEILQSVLENGHKIVIVGVGKSGNIGHKIAATLTSTGAPSIVLNAQNALHGDMGIVQDGDAIIAMSHSGETEELLKILPFLRQFSVQIIGLSGNPHSTLAKNSDVFLSTEVQREACPLNLAPTSSSTVMLVLGDALAMVLLEARGFHEKDFARLHPSGSLGRHLLTKVSDVMRTGARLALAQPEQKIDAILHIMSAAKSGACVIINEKKELLGIFTHGDFARAFQEKQDLSSATVQDLMTQQPITIEQGKLATEIIHLAREHKVDEFVVVDEQNHPVGIIDTQDLSQMKLL